MTKGIFYLLICIFCCVSHLNAQETNNFGIWKVENSTDRFGDTTKYKQVYTVLPGQFSNSTTTNADLLVKLIIARSSIQFVLYENSGTTPTRGRLTLAFSVKDAQGKVNKFKTRNDKRGTNYVKTSNYTLAKALLAGGEVKFVGYSKRSDYKFTIENADYLENAISEAGLSLPDIRNY